MELKECSVFRNVFTFSHADYDFRHEQSFDFSALPGILFMLSGILLLKIVLSMAIL